MALALAPAAAVAEGAAVGVFMRSREPPATAACLGPKIGMNEKSIVNTYW